MNQEKTGMQKKSEENLESRKPGTVGGVALLSWPRGFQIGCLCPLPAFLMA
jgi:hypothetical protein